jgi:hypothetical protein
MHSGITASNPIQRTALVPIEIGKKVSQNLFVTGTPAKIPRKLVTKVREIVAQSFQWPVRSSNPVYRAGSAHPSRLSITDILTDLFMDLEHEVLHSQTRDVYIEI